MTIEEQVQIKARKRELQEKLYAYQTNFLNENGRHVTKPEDMEPMAKEYKEYKVINKFI